MKILKESFKETLMSVSPVVIIVILLSLFVVDITSSMMWSFILGALLIIVGLGIFLYGIETGMEPAGKKFGNTVAETASRWLIAFISFILGFSVTVEIGRASWRERVLDRV